MSAIAGSDAPPPILELNDATLVRGGRAILKDVTLRVNQGEHLAIVGPNGSGKSSLIQLLTRQQYPLYRTGGLPPIRLFGEEHWDVAELRTRMGIVSPDLQHRFVSGTDTGRLRALDAVVSGFLAAEVIFLHHRISEGMWARGREALARVGVSHLAERPIDAMSTGEARRVLIARALVHEPAVLVLDEPTAGLDPVARESFLMDLGRITREGTTLLLITHHVEEILPEVERVVLLRAGQVLYDGPKELVLTGDRLAETFAAQVEVEERDGRYTLRLGAHRRGGGAI